MKKLSYLKSLIWFMLKMNAMLWRNRHKSGWHKCTATALLNRIKEETVELETELKNYYYISEGFSTLVSPETNKTIINEAADVANFAMMVATKFRT